MPPLPMLSALRSLTGLTLTVLPAKNECFTTWIRLAAHLTIIARETAAGPILDYRLKGRGQTTMPDTDTM